MTIKMPSGIFHTIPAFYMLATWVLTGTAGTSRNSHGVVQYSFESSYCTAQTISSFYSWIIFFCCLVPISRELRLIFSYLYSNIYFYTFSKYESVQVSLKHYFLHLFKAGTHSERSEWINSVFIGFQLARSHICVAESYPSDS